MMCPYCGQEMEQGYIVSDARRAIAWRKDKHESAVVKDEEGIQLARQHFFESALNFGEAYCCKVCKKIVIDYERLI
mgnify:CR=1 FL=1